MHPPAFAPVHINHRPLARRRSCLLVACGVLLLASCSAPAPSDVHVSPPFRAFYALHHGADTLGAALFTRQVTNGGLVQYFANGVLEFHPGLPPGSQVFLSALGEEFGEDADAAVAYVKALWFGTVLEPCGGGGGLPEAADDVGV